MPKPNTDGGYLLPGVVDPPRRCVQLYIPDDPQHIRAFWGALTDLSRWFSWQRDDAKTGTQVAQVWREVIELAFDLFNSDNPCPCEEDPLTDCCDLLLEKLDTIIGLMMVGRQPDPILQINFRQDINNILADPGFAVTDLDPNAPDVSYTEGTGDVDALEDRQRALCHVLYLAILTLMNTTRNSVVLAGLEISLDLFLAGWWLPSAAVSIGTIIAGGLVTEALGDENAQTNVICCMVDQLTGLPTTKQNLIDAAQACEDGGNETLIGEALAGLFADDDNWGSFVHDLGQAFDRIQAGQALYCPCFEVEGVVCDEAGTVVGINLPAGGGSGWTLDANLGACEPFGTLLGGGGDFQGASSFCLHSVSLQRFYGGTASNEALYAKVTVNGRAYYQAIEPNVHCTIDITPHQLITDTEGFRVDLLGGGERMCYTGVRFTGVAVT